MKQGEEVCCRIVGLIFRMPLFILSLPFIFPDAVRRQCLNVRVRGVVFEQIRNSRLLERWTKEWTCHMSARKANLTSTAVYTQETHKISLYIFYCL